MSIHTGQIEGQSASTETETATENPEETSSEMNGSTTQSTDNVGGSSVEINIDELVTEFEAEVRKEAEKGGCTGRSARQRLDDMLERRRAAEELDVLDDFQLDSTAIRLTR